MSPSRWLTTWHRRILFVQRVQGFGTGGDEVFLHLDRKTRSNAGAFSVPTGFVPVGNIHIELIQPMKKSSLREMSFPRALCGVRSGLPVNTRFRLDSRSKAGFDGKE